MDEDDDVFKFDPLEEGHDAEGYALYPHEVSLVECDLCRYRWVAVRPAHITKLECPNCENTVLFRNIEIEE